jgi:hypothetical protein
MDLTAMSYGAVLSNDAQEELMQMRDDFSNLSWRTGDIANREIALNRNNDTKVTNAFIYSAVASFIGKKGRTVREYAKIADTFPPETRKKYDVLTFDHFRHASRLDKPEEALDWCLEQIDELGRPATVDHMIMQFGDWAMTDSSMGLMQVLEEGASAFKQTLHQLGQIPNLKQDSMYLSGAVDDYVEKATQEIRVSA